jgi:hypothetical protein
MKDLIRLASLLDRNGNYLLADKLDKIAQQSEYTEAINNYKKLLQEEKFDEAEIVRQNFIDKLNSQMSDNLQFPDQYKRLSNEQYVFELQADRLLTYYKNKGAGFFTEKALQDNISSFGLYNAKDVNDFNNKWKQFIDWSKRKGFIGIPNTSTTIYNFPYVQQQLALLYNQLKNRYLYQAPKG